MQDDDRIDQWFQQWLAAKTDGQVISAAHLCGENADLVPEFARRIESWSAAHTEVSQDTTEDDPILAPKQSSSHTAREAVSETVVWSVQELRDRIVHARILTGRSQEACDEILRQSVSATQAVSELLGKELLTDFQLDALAGNSDPCLRLGDYVLLDRIGKGGMGEVFRGRHVHMKREVAIKRLPQKLLQQPQYLQRFRREIEATAKLEHPHLVTAYDAGEDQGYHFLVMKYVRGSDLNAVVQTQGSFSPTEAMRLLSEAAEGLLHIHRAGMVHRDIKPRNLMLDDEGHIQILDLGLATPHVDSETDDITVQGSFIGTAAYCAPEQAEDPHAADQRSDLYSLGCTSYFLLTGQPPYPGDSVTGSIIAHQDLPVPDVQAITPDCPRELNTLIQQLLAKSPDERIQTAAELIERIQQCQSARAPENILAAAPLYRRIVPWTGRILLLAGIIFAAFTFWPEQEAQQTAHQSDFKLNTPPSGVDINESAATLSDVDRPVASSAGTIVEKEIQDPQEILLAKRILNLGGTFRYLLDGDAVTIRQPDQLIPLESSQSAWWIDRVDLPNVKTLTLEDFRLMGSRQKLKFLNAPATNTTDEMVALLRDSPSLTQVHVEHSTISDNGIESISNIATLTGVELTGTQVTDIGIAMLPLQQMTAIAISYCPVGDETWKKLAEASHLEDFEASGFDLSDEQLSVVSGMKYLNRLALCDCQLNDTDVRKITQNCRDLRVLYIHTNPITDAAIPDFLQLTKPRRVDVSYTAVTPAGLAKLQDGLPECEITANDLEKGWHWLPQNEADRKVANRVAELGGYLDLVKSSGGGLRWNTEKSGNLTDHEPFRVASVFLQRTNTQQLTEMDFQQMARLPELSTIFLPNANVTDAMVAILSECLTLKVVQIENCPITDASLLSLSKLNDLTYLDLSGCPVTADGLSHLKLDSLVTLDLVSTNMTDQLGAELKRCKSLEILRLSAAAITPAVWDALAALPTLTSLSIDNGLDNTLIADVARLKQIKQLFLVNVPITNAAVTTLSQMKKLTNLSVSGTHLSQQGLDELQAALPDCEIVADASVRDNDWKNEQSAIDLSVARRALELGGYLTMVTLDGYVTYYGKDDQPSLEKMQPFQVTGVGLQSAQTQELTRQDFQAFAQLPSLHGLLLRVSNVTDEMLSELKNSLTLRSIDVAHTDVTDFGLEMLSELPTLASVEVGDSQVTQAGILRLPLQQLSNLSITGIDVDDDFWKQMLKANKLARFVALGTPMTTAALDTLGQLPLGVLYLNDCGIDDSKAARLSELSMIARLHLRSNPLTDAGILHLKPLTTLQFVDLRGTQITSAGATELKEALPNCEIQVDRGLSGNE